MPKGTDEGVRLTADAVPVPDRLAVCGLPLALSVRASVAARALVAVGVNVTLMVQLVLAASVEGLRGQLFVWPKSPGFVPPIAMLVIVNGALPVFESVTAWAGLVVLTCWLPKGTDEGVRVTVGTVPVPERLTVCGLPVALSLKVRPALRLPAAVGVNVTLMVQLVLAASVEGLMGQLFVWPKSPGFVPLMAMLVIVNGALPVFESVTA